MARAKRFSDVRRMLRRKLSSVGDSEIAALRDELWDVLIARRFMRGASVTTLASDQPDRNRSNEIEAALRRRYRMRG